MVEDLGSMVSWDNEDVNDAGENNGIEVVVVEDESAVVGMSNTCEFEEVSVM